MKSGEGTLEEDVLGGEVEFGAVVGDGPDPLEHLRGVGPLGVEVLGAPEQGVDLLLVAVGPGQDLGGTLEVEAGQHVEQSLEVVGHVANEHVQVVQDEPHDVQNYDRNLVQFVAVIGLGGGRRRVGHDQRQDHLEDAVADQLVGPPHEVAQEDEEELDDVLLDFLRCLGHWNTRCGRSRGCAAGTCG